jgi:Diiron non-heme beta-hydroxylase N-terminal domain/Beta-lactamase superfamily domain
MNDMAHQEPVYLKPDAKLEVTSNRWFVWPHLLAPVQRACNFAFRYVPSMQSFVANPQLHIDAARNPQLAGGPYINLPLDDVPKVKDLLERTLRDCAPLIAFANDLRAFNKMLKDTATGESLDRMYALLPESLAGKVELVYDVNNQPTIRVIEEIVYRSALAANDRFEVALSDISDEDRTFFMNTPRLDDERMFFAEVRLDDPMIDTLTSMRLSPKPLHVLEPLFGAATVGSEAFRRLFTAEPPKRNDPAYHGDRVRMRYFGHACVLLQSARATVLIDPVVTCDAGDDGRLTLLDLPDRIDYCVFSHGHQDHLSAEMMLQLRRRVGTFVVPRNKSGSIADPSLKLMLQRLGCRNVHAADVFDEIAFDGGRIVSMPFTGEHGDLDIYSKQTIFVEIEGRRFFFLVDSDAIDPALYDTVAQMVGRVDGLFIGMECFGAPMSWLYGPLLGKPLSRKDSQSRRLSASNSERAWRFVTKLGCSKAFIYALGQEPWMRYLMGEEFAEDSVQLQQIGTFLSKCNEGGVDVEYVKISKELFY